jgi:prophage regulatory protein
MKILSYADLPDKGITFSRMQLWRLIKAGHFPKPIKLSAQRVGFVESEVDAWLKAKIAERDAAASSAA